MIHSAQRALRAIGLITDKTIGNGRPWPWPYGARGIVCDGSDCVILGE